MDKISSYFNDCFSDNYYVFALTHKTNVNIDEEVKHIETTKTIIFDQSIREDSTISKDDSEEERKDQPQPQQASKIAVISKETFVTHYITNLNVTLHPPKVVKGVIVYPLIDKRNKICTERTFEDFWLLRRALAAHFPACFIPVLPHRDFYTMAGPNAVEDRKYKALKEFWPRVFELPHLTATEIFQAFIDPNCYVTKALDRYLKPSWEEIVARYKVSFQHLGGLSVDENVYNKIDRFEEFVNIGIKKVKQLLDFIRNYQKLEATAQLQEMSFYSELKGLEQAILAGNFSEEFTMGLNTNFMLHLYDLSRIQKGGHLQIILDFLYYELADFEAIKEAISLKKGYEINRKEKKAKLLSLRKEASETFNKVDKLTRLMNSIKILEGECEKLDMLINLMNANVGYFEIEKYKVNKYKMYGDTLKSFCRVHSPAVAKVKEYVDNVILLITSKSKEEAISGGYKEFL